MVDGIPAGAADPDHFYHRACCLTVYDLEHCCFLLAVL
jgi:hypothetical protein